VETLKTISGLTKPSALQRGDTIGIVSPSSTPDLKNLKNGIAWLNEQGFFVISGKSVLERHGYLAGRDDQRAFDLMNMFEREDIDAVWCAQGGYGSMRVLRHLDFSVIRENPKIFVGYSDITGFHAAFQIFARLVTFHGPLVAHELGRDFTEYTKRSVIRTLMSTEAPIEVRNPPLWPPCLTIYPGTAEGPIVGGNLSLVANLMGTPFEIDFDGCIVFLEDVSEAPYRIDRMLVQLLLAGKLQKAKGIIIGECTDCVPSKPELPTLELEEIFRELIAPLQIPSFYGLTVGHGRHKSVIPIGVHGHLDSANHSLVIQESGVK